MLTLEQPKLESKFLDPVPPVAAKIFEKSSSSNSRSYFDLDFASFQKKTVSPIIMVQWKLAAVFERSHFSLNHGAMGGRESTIQNLLSLHRTCPDIPQLNIARIVEFFGQPCFFHCCLVVWDRETPRRVSRKSAQISCSRRAKLRVFRNRFLKKIRPYLSKTLIGKVI